MQPGYQQGSEPMWWWKVAQHLDEAQLAFANAMAHNVDDPRLMQALYDRLRDGQAILLEIFRAKGLIPGATNGTAGGPMPGEPAPSGPMPGGPAPSGPMHVMPIPGPMPVAPMPAAPVPMPAAPPPMHAPSMGMPMSMPFPPMRADDIVEIPGQPPLGVNEPAVAEADHAAAAAEPPPAEPPASESSQPEPVVAAVAAPEESTAAATSDPATGGAGG